MAYKLTEEQREKANFIRSFNKNLENAYKSFGKGSEVYQNLVAFANIHGLTSSKSNFDFYQASASKATLNSINIKEIKSDYYSKNNITIRSMYNTAEKKEISTRILKKGQANTLQEAYKIATTSSLVIELYKEVMETDVPPDIYNEMCDILEDYRKGTMTTTQLNKMKEYADSTYTRVGDTFVDEHGEIIYDLRPDDEYIDPI